MSERGETEAVSVKGTPRRRRLTLGLLALAAVPMLVAVQACSAPGSDPQAAGASALLSAPPVTPPASAAKQTPDAAGSAGTASARPRENPLGVTAASYLAQRTGTVTAAVYDVSTGQTWTLGSGRPQDEASIVKLNILEALYAQQPGGSAQLSAADTSLAQKMMEDSDNDAATSLWYAAGGPGHIKSFDTAAGLTHTAPSECVECPGFPWPGWGLTTTTPTDQLALLRALVKSGTLLDSAQRSSVLKLMENVDPAQRWGVTGGVPAKVTVALKNGWLPLNTAATNWQINSMGWVSGQGRNYLMAVLSTGNPSEQYGIDTISRLSTLVWNGLG